MPNEGVITVGASSVSVLRNRYGIRIDYVLTNTSSGGQVISIRRGDVAAVAGEAIVLQPNESTGEGTFIVPCYQGPIQAIADAAGGTLAFSERLK